LNIFRIDEGLNELLDKFDFSTINPFIVLDGLSKLLSCIRIKYSFIVKIVKIIKLHSRSSVNCQYRGIIWEKFKQLLKGICCIRSNQDYELGVLKFEFIDEVWINFNVSFSQISVLANDECFAQLWSKTCDQD